MEEDQRKKIEELIGQIKCPKAFKCYTSGFEDLCRSRDIGLDSYLECLEEEPRRCTFAFAFGHTYFCKCPLRVYLAKHEKK